MFWLTQKGMALILVHLMAMI